jgi:carbon-monoxide dehydrogenase iron sulfur subunit
MVDTEKMKLEKQMEHIKKVSELGKKTKKEGLDILDILTAKTRAKDALKQGGKE